MLRELDGRWPGLFGRGFELAERLAQAGIAPGMFLAWGLPRALAGADTRPWLEAECLAWAGDLAAAGADPEPALSYAVPPMREMAGTDAEVFRTLRAALQDFIAMLAGLGLDYRDILFYDISALAENQAEESEAFIALLRRLGELVRLLVQFHHDPTAGAGERAAGCRARRRQNRWVLEESLDASLRLAAPASIPGGFLSRPQALWPRRPERTGQLSGGCAPLWKIACATYRMLPGRPCRRHPAFAAGAASGSTRR